MAPNNDDSIKVDGKKEAAALLAALDPETRQRILSGIEKSDPALASALQKGMITFEKLIELDSNELLKVFQKFPNSLIALAIRGLDPILEKELFSKLSLRQGNQIREERDSMGPRKKSEVDSARETLTEHARALQDNGEIHLLKNR